MEKAYFTNIRREIIEHLHAAKQEVVVAMAWFTSDELFQSLLDCLKRGVKVELVLLDNPTNFMYYAPDFNIFIENGGVLRIAKVENGFMHHKFCVIDDSIAITGSYNWTYYAETRNIENIVITDNEEVIAQYKKEFADLSFRTAVVENSPKLEWTEIETFQYINFDELNYEIENIAKAKNLPERKVVRSSTTVTVEDRPRNPMSGFDFGVRHSTEDDHISMKVIIKKGVKLPYTSNEVQLFNNLNYRSNVMFTVLLDYEGDKMGIAEKNITEITNGRTDENLEMRIQFTLMPSGDLFAEIRCVETGKVISVKASNPEFVNYAE